MGQKTRRPVVFIVDDDDAMRDSMATMIESLNLETQRFSSAEDFLARGDTSRRGCLLLDIRMPGMSGFELHERLTAEGVTLPIIFISGHGAVSRRNAEKSAGVVAFLEKPSRPEVLAKAIRKAIALSTGESNE